MSDGDDRYDNCLICGHRVWKHNFYEATRTTVPCPDCPDGQCRSRSAASVPS